MLQFVNRKLCFSPHSCFNFHDSVPIAWIWKDELNHLVLWDRAGLDQHNRRGQQHGNIEIWRWINNCTNYAKKDYEYILKNLGKRKRPFLISVPVSELLKAIPYDAGTYCRIPDVKVDQIIQKVLVQMFHKRKITENSSNHPSRKKWNLGFLSMMLRDGCQ